MSLSSELWLSVDLSSTTGSIALHAFKRGKLRFLSEVCLEDGGKHSESVLGGIQAALDEAGEALPSVTRYLTNRGPGSFTGLRIAFSTLKAFAFASGHPMELIDGHEVSALVTLAGTKEKETKITTQISRDVFLVSRYRADGLGGVERVSEELLQNPDGGKVVPFHARFLAETLVFAKSRKTLALADDVALAAPSYFGTRNYQLFTPAGEPNADSRSHHEQRHQEYRS